MNFLYKKIFSFDIINESNKLDNGYNNESNMLKAFLVFLDNHFPIKVAYESPITTLFPEISKPGTYTSSIGPISGGKWIYELIPSRSNSFKFGWAVCKTNEKLTNFLPKTYKILDPKMGVKKVSVHRPDGQTFSCAIDVSNKSQTISYYSNGTLIDIQILNLDKIKNDNINDEQGSSSSSTITKGSENEDDDINNSGIFYMPYIHLEERMGCAINFGARPLTFSFKEFKPIIEENVEISKRVFYLVSVFLKVLSSKDILVADNDSYKDILAWLTPILATNLTLYTVESILIHSLYDNHSIIDDFIEALSLNLTESLFKTTMKQIFSTITFDCRPTPYGSIIPLQLFFRFLQNNITLQFFLLENSNLLILDYIFSKEACLVNEYSGFSREKRTTSQLDKNINRSVVQREIFKFCLQSSSHSLFENDLYDLIKSWMIRVINSELNHEKEKASGKTNEEYPFTFLFGLFNMLAEYLEPILINENQINRIPMFFLVEKDYDSPNRQRLGGVLSYLSKISKFKPFQDDDHSPDHRPLDNKTLSLLEILINLLDISICKQFQKIDSHPSNILQYFFLNLDMNNLLKCLNIETLKYQAIKEEIKEEMLTVDYIWVVFTFLVRFLNRIVCHKNKDYFNYVYDHFFTTTISIFSYFVETDKLLITSPSNLKTTATFISILLRSNNHIVDRSVSQKVSLAIAELLKVNSILVLIHNLPSFPMMVRDLFINLNSCDLVIITLLFNASLEPFTKEIDNLFQEHGIYLLKLLKSLFSQIPQHKKLINLLNYLSNKMSHLILEDETFLMITGQFYLYVFEKITLVSAKEKKNFVKLFYKLLPSIYYFSQYQPKSKKLSFAKSIKKIDVDEILKVLDEFTLNGSNYKIKPIIPPTPLIQQQQQPHPPQHHRNNSVERENSDEHESEDGDVVNLDDEDFNDPEAALVNIISTFTSNNSFSNSFDQKYKDKSSKDKDEEFETDIEPTVKEKLISFFKSINDTKEEQQRKLELELANGGDEDDETLCTICYSSQENTEFLPCKHRSCHHCIILHLLTKNTCFFCRKKINKFYFINDDNNNNHTDNTTINIHVDDSTNNNNNNSNNNDEFDETISIEQQEIEHQRSIHEQLSQQLKLHRHRSQQQE